MILKEEYLYGDFQALLLQMNTIVKEVVIFFE